MKHWILDIYGTLFCRGCGSTRPHFHTLVCPYRWKDWNRD